MKYNITVFLLLQFCFSGFTQQNWQSKFVKTDENHKLVYIPDERGNVIPISAKWDTHRVKRKFLLCSCSNH
jgi:hypothetical protein